ncbi:hypothetical protein [Methanoregula sp.]|uniref:hypothetical protein n=1 Tax=Methanoregula sp. TaxID=2052170 RepID=UPI003C4CC2B3
MTIARANAGDTIILNPGTYYENNVTIKKDITIRANVGVGGNAKNTLIDAQGTGRIFYNQRGISLTLDNLTLIGGQLSNTPDGGAIYSDGSLLITSCIIMNSSTSYSGGAIFSSGSLTIISSTISNCSATIAGGGIEFIGSEANIISSLITGCSSGQGGAIDSTNYTVVNSSTISDCIAQGGGGAISSEPPLPVNGDSLDITSSTFTNCTAGVSEKNSGGGAIGARGEIAIFSSTIENCSVENGGRGGAIADIGGSDGASVFILTSRLVNDDRGTAIYAWAPVDARYNWWGSNDNPSSHFSEMSTDYTANYTPWLELRITSSSYLYPNQQNAIRADLFYASDGSYINLTYFKPPDIPVVFEAPEGNVRLEPLYGTLMDGTNSTTIIPETSGIAIVDVSADNQTDSLIIPILGPDTTFSSNVITSVSRDWGMENVTIDNQTFAIIIPLNPTNSTIPDAFWRVNPTLPVTTGTPTTPLSFTSALAGIAVTCIFFKITQRRK